MHAHTDQPCDSKFGRYLRAGVLVKSKVAPMSESAFLGFTIKGKKVRWTDKALADFKHRIKKLTARNWGNTCGGGRRTLVSASITARYPNWTSGSDGVSECATENSGAGRARKSRTCWHWA
nr:hypothetical protein [Candidatus Symbiobacter mobilis]